MGMGYTKQALDLLNTTSYEELIDAVKKAVSETEPGQWITGRGWHQSKWGDVPGKTVEGFPTHHMLSEVSPENPVFLRHASGHAALANKMAMDMAGVTVNTVFDEGGEVLTDENGEPTGIFNERAMGMIIQHIPPPGKDERVKAFKSAVKESLENGITSFHDAGVDLGTLKLYKEMLDSGEMKIRLYVMLSSGDHELVDRYFVSGPEKDLGNGFLTIRAIKVYADGALGSRGAWLLEPYSDLPGEYGHSTEDPEFIYQVSKLALEKGFQVCTHAIGDRANREVLNMYEKALREIRGIKDHRFRIEHAQHLGADDIPRFAQLGVIPAMQAIHLSSDRPWAIDRLGKERIEEGAYVWQKLLQSGAKIVNGTDVPVEPIHPVACFYASVTRMTLEGTPEGGFEPDQKMSREQALRSYTIDAAYGEFGEKIKGSIEPGKLADFTIFSRDLMTIPDDQLLSTEVVMTVVDGKILFEK
jgi:hypothetical protein